MPEMKATVGASRACSRCGAQVTAQEGAKFHCRSCGNEERIETVARAVRSYPVEMISTLRRQYSNQVLPTNFTCAQCGGRSSERALATLCSYCRSPMVADVKASPLIAPEGLLRFAINEELARYAIRQWIRGRSLAPTALQNVADAENMTSWYLPFWMFDMRLHASYEGTAAYSGSTSASDDGEWRRVRGTASRQLTGVQHEASGMSARGDLARMRFQLDEVRPFQSDFLRGHTAPFYELEPEQSFEALQPLIDEYAMQIIKADIGGDVRLLDWHQRWATDIKFRLCYLPVWACSYVYRGKTWPVLVNGQTGAVSGARPYSKIKLVVVLFVALIVLPAPVVLTAVFFGTWAFIVGIVEFFSVVSLEAFVNEWRYVGGVLSAISDFWDRRGRSETTNFRIL